MRPRVITNRKRYVENARTRPTASRIIRSRDSNGKMIGRRNRNIPPRRQRVSVIDLPEGSRGRVSIFVLEYVDPVAILAHRPDCEIRADNPSPAQLPYMQATTPMLRTRLVDRVQSTNPRASSRWEMKPLVLASACPYPFLPHTRPTELARSLNSTPSVSSNFSDRLSAEACSRLLKLASR